MNSKRIHNLLARNEELSPLRFKKKLIDQTEAKVNQKNKNMFNIPVSPIGSERGAVNFQLQNKFRKSC